MHRHLVSVPRPASRAVRSVLALLAACGLLALGAGCKEARARRSPRVPIVVATADQRSVPYEIEATGTVEPIQSADVTSQVGGLVTRIFFREGDEVRRGQPLFQIDPRPYQADLSQALAVLARDRARAETARLDFNRAQTLAKQQMIAAMELEQKRSDYAAAAATVRADSAAVVSSRLNLTYAAVRAPIGGKTGNVGVHLGDLVKANETTTPLVSIKQLRPIRVRFPVTQADIPVLRRQREANVRVDVSPAELDSAWIEGKLAFIDNQVDPATGTLMLKGEFPNGNGALWPGQFVRVRARLYEQLATVVPNAAITSSQSGTYCYVVKPDTTVENRPVRVQRTWRDLALLASGVSPGEMVVVDGQLRLSPGAKAVIRSPATEAGGLGGGTRRGGRGAGAGAHGRGGNGGTAESVR